MPVVVFGKTNHDFVVNPAISNVTIAKKFYVQSEM